MASVETSLLILTRSFNSVFELSGGRRAEISLCVLKCSIQNMLQDVCQLLVGNFIVRDGVTVNIPCVYFSMRVSV
jgi:hypothetical protein